MQHEKCAVTVIDKENGKVSFHTEDDFMGFMQLRKLIFHSETEPAFISRYSDGTTKEEKWLVNNRLYRNNENESSYTVYWPDGVISDTQFFKKDGNDYIGEFRQFFRNGNISEIRKSFNERLHGKDALVKYDLDGNIIEKHSFNHGAILQKESDDE